MTASIPAAVSSCWRRSRSTRPRTSHIQQPHYQWRACERHLNETPSRSVLAPDHYDLWLSSLRVSTWSSRGPCSRAGRSKRQCSDTWTEWCPSAILASPSGAESQLHRDLPRPSQDVIGLHFFSRQCDAPARKWSAGARRGDVTSTASFWFPNAMADRGGFRVCDGFIANRMLARYGAHATTLSCPRVCRTIDVGLQEFGMAWPVFRVVDLSGLDIGWRCAAASGLFPGRLPNLAGRICCEPPFPGQTCRRLYRYEPGSRHPLPDAEGYRHHRQYRWQEHHAAHCCCRRDRRAHACSIPGQRKAPHHRATAIAQTTPSYIDRLYLTATAFKHYRRGPMFFLPTMR